MPRESSVTCVRSSPGLVTLPSRFMHSSNRNSYSLGIPIPLEIPISQCLHANIAASTLGRGKGDLLAQRLAVDVRRRLDHEGITGICLQVAFRRDRQDLPGDVQGIRDIDFDSILILQADRLLGG